MYSATTIEPGRIELQEYAAPDLPPDHALVRMERVGICGSDLHIYAGHHPTATFPRIQGHEGSGLIAEFPPRYAGPFRVGQRVAIDPLITCGSCYPCSIGRSSSCPNSKVLGAHIDGFLKEYVPVPVVNLYDASDLTPDETALIEPASVGYQAASRAALQPGEQALIIGAGPIGLCIAIACLDKGAHVAIVDKEPHRLEIARQIGVDLALLAGTDDVEAALSAWTNNRGPQIAFDAVGAPSVIRQCCDVVSPAGRVVIVGLSDREVSLPVVDFVYKELTVLGSRAAGGHFGDAVDLVRRQRSLLTSLITHRFPLADVQQGIEFALNNPASTMKVLIDLEP